MNRSLHVLAPAALLLLGASPAAAQRRGAVPHLAFSAGSLSFSRPGETRAVEIKNVGASPLNVTAVRIWSGNNVPTVDFTVEPVPPQVLLPGASIAARVSLRSNAGEKQAFGALQVSADDPELRSDPAMPGARVGSVALRANASGGLFGILSWIVFFPLLAIPVLFLVPKGREPLTRWIALGAAAVPMALALYVYVRFDPGTNVASGHYGLQFIEHYTWIGAFNIEYFLGVDGISITMVLLTALVSLIAVGASWSIPLDRHIRGYFSMFLLLEVGMMGVFCALDFFLFYVFWEVMLLPMYFLIGIWGGPRKEYAAIKFFLYTLAGSVLMLLAIIALYYNSNPSVLIDGTPAPHTFNLMKLAYANDFSGKGAILGVGFTRIVWMGLFIGFAIKVPMFPFHTWLPDAHVEAPTAISVILAGVLLKMGTYGMMRINWPMLPDATRWFCGLDAAQPIPWVGIFGAISILYGALCAMAQTDLKKMVAYSSVSHMGYCLLGMSAMTQTGMNGALMQMFNHGTITSMLFMLVGVLYDRTHTRGLDEFGGVAAVMPRYAAFFGVAFMASLGLPGLSGFIGEALVFIGAFPAFQVLTVIAALSVIITAAYHLWAIQRIQLGKFNEKWRHELDGHDMSFRELATHVPLVVIVLVLGFWPAPILGTISAGVLDLVHHVTAAGGPGTIAALLP